MDHFILFSSMLKNKVDILALVPHKEKIEKLSNEKIAQAQFLDLKSSMAGFLLRFISTLCFGLPLMVFIKGI